MRLCGFLIALATFSNVSAMDQIIPMSVCYFIHNHWTSCHEIWHKHSGSPEDESYNFSSSLTLLLLLSKLLFYR